MIQANVKHTLTHTHREHMQNATEVPKCTKEENDEKEKAKKKLSPQHEHNCLGMPNWGIFCANFHRPTHEKAVSTNG